MMAVNHHVVDISLAISINKTTKRKETNTINPKI